VSRQQSTNFGSPGIAFPYATSPTDQFSREDVQLLAQAVNLHDHSPGRGLSVIGGTQVLRAGGAGPVSTTATAWVDIPNLIISGTFNGGHVVVWISMMAYVQGPASASFGLRHNADTRYLGWMQPGAQGEGIIAMVFSLGTLTGTHAIAGRWYADAVGGVAVFADTREIVVVEFR
jgi:hypothetical protein